MVSVTQKFYKGSSRLFRVVSSYTSNPQNPCHSHGQIGIPDRAGDEAIRVGGSEWDVISSLTKLKVSPWGLFIVYD